MGRHVSQVVRLSGVSSPGPVSVGTRSAACERKARRQVAVNQGSPSQEAERLPGHRLGRQRRQGEDTEVRGFRVFRLTSAMISPELSCSTVLDGSNERKSSVLAFSTMTSVTDHSV